MVDLLSQPPFAEAWASGAGAFRTLADNLDQCVALFDSEGRCAAFNRAFAQWLSRPETEVLGRTVFDLWPRPFAEQEVIENQRVLRGERIEVEEERPRNGQPVPVRLVKAPVQEADGAVRGVLCLFTPLGLTPPGRESRVRGTEAERQASKMELLGRLTAGIVHDFNNLLTVQLNNLALLQAALPPGTALEEPLQALRKAINQGAALTDRLLMMVRKSSRSSRPIDLNAICTEAAELLRHTIPSRIRLETHLRPGLPPVYADGGQIMQVLMNLCLNAADAMPRGGKLLIETEERGLTDSSHPQAATRNPRARYACLHVVDTGEGIPADVRPHIFEPFFTTKRSGSSSGLGLSIVREIVQRAEGWIECDSAVGRGTHFTVWLPAAAREQPSEDITPPPLRSLGQKTILVADNEPSIVQLAETILRRAGYRVLSAEDGRQALEIYRQKKGLIDLVILDQDMPELSGVETMNELLAIDPEVRVLLVTGSESPESWGAGMSGWGFLGKPYTVEQLVGSVRDLLVAKTRNG